MAKNGSKKLCVRCVRFAALQVSSQARTRLCPFLTARPSQAAQPAGPEQNGALVPWCSGRSEHGCAGSAAKVAKGTFAMGRDQAGTSVPQELRAAHGAGAALTSVCSPEQGSITGHFNCRHRSPSYSATG